MDIDKLLAEINSAGVFLALKDGQLKSKAQPDAMTAELASQIKEHKSDIIRFLRSRENKPLLSKVPRNKPLMLSSAQQRMWFLQQLHTGSSLYNEPKVLKISGRLNVEALSNALKLIVERHEILRTCYYEEEGGVFGHVIPADDFEISITNGSVDRSIEYHQKTPFDLCRDYAVRAELVHAVDSYLLIICFHHVAVDGWSYNILIDELIKSYQSFNQGDSPDFPVLPFQYGDYASWERERQDDAALAYWQKRLADIVEYPLLLDKPCDNQHSDAGKSLRRRLPTATGTALKQLAKVQDVTVFSLLQTAFSYLLYRHQGHDESTVRDVVIGVPVANRDMKEVEQMVGLFVNSVVIRTTINPEFSFIELLTEHKTNLLSDYQHQQMPFERLVDNLRPHRRLNRNPLFQTMIALREGQFKRLELEDLVIEQMDVNTSSARLDLTLIIEESGEEIIFVWEYASNLFDETTIDLIANRYETLLEAIIRNPLVKLNNLQLVTEKEKAVLLSDWIGKQAEFCEDKCLHELFEAQVEKSPNAKAVTHEGQHLTYKELNEKANQLAHYLIQRGVVADSLVGICTEASFELIIGIMGILKAGGAYVPVDPSNPEARIKRMLEDSGVTLLLTQSCLKESLSIKDLEAVYLDDSSFNKRLKIFSDHNIASSSLGIEANNLAYVIYTSGSTGHPKGVMVERGGLRNLVQWYSREYGLSSTDVALIPSSIGFDLTQKNLFSMLAVGGHLVFPARGSYDPVELLSAIKSNGVTCINCAPSMFYGVIGNAQANNFFDLQTLRYVFFGGETINRNLLTEWLSDASCSAEIINMYGPTECTDIVTSHTLAQGSDTSIIGRSIPNVSTYVLNAQKELQHIGGCGELYIGGLGLSRGYLNNPPLTAERFIPNPFHDPHNRASSARLYRTGDLVRYLPNGDLQFLGRIDHQVKIRGFRIELGEIEHALNALEDVKQAVVSAQESATGDHYLVAYVVLSQAADEQPPARISGVLRARLKQSLPEYMVPAAFVILDALPLTTNGKVDRKALPVPEAAPQGDAFVAPTTELETQLCDLWQQVLGVKRVGITDNFFELGGHSLIATRLVSEANRQLHLPLTLKALFHHQTIQSLAPELQTQDHASPHTPAITPFARDTLLLPSYAQQRLWLLNKIEGDSAHYNMPGGLRLSGDLNIDALEKALRTIIQRHESLRTCFREHAGDEGKAIQIIQDADRFQVDHTDLSHLQGHAQEAALADLVENEAGRLFDLSHDFMLRARLIRLAEREHVLLVTMHHIASDGWSMSILIHEFCVLYRAWVLGLEARLPELPIQYVDYAHWQREWLQGDVLDRQLGYWVEQLSSLPVVHGLPLDRARPAVQSFSGKNHYTRLNARLTKQLRERCQARDATLFMGLHAAFSVLLSRYSNETDIVVGSPIANREQAEVANLIGFFMNVLVLRSDLSGSPSFNDVLERSQQTLLEAYSHQQVPFEQLVEKLQPERSLNHSPLFQVMLVLQNTDESVIKLPGLDSALLEKKGQIAKYDLILMATEDGNELLLDWEFSTDLFELATMKRMAESFEVLLESLTNAPEVDVFEVDMLGKSATSNRLTSSKDADRKVAEDKCFHELFESHAAETPDAVAVVYEGKELTYGELNSQSNKLASFLAESRNITPDTLIGIFIERSPEMIIGLLAILKAGGAYVPLDPNYPEERLEYMLKDAGLQTVLTHSHLVERIPLGKELMLCMDDKDFWKALATQSNKNRCPQEIGLEAAHLAYVIYTSGSTGKPKGVMIEHAAVVNYVSYCATRYFPSVEGAVVSTSLSFDATVTSLLTPLSCGKTVHLINDDNREIESLAYRLCSSVVPYLFKLTPAHLQALQSHIVGVPCSQVKHVLVIGGEQLTSQNLLKWKEHLLPQSTFINEYGPTEATVGCSTFFATSARDINAERAAVSIGLPISNAQLYVLDKRGRVTPDGVAGELHIAGLGVARGYLNQDELTNNRFINNPFSTEPTSRLYRTGDLVRRLPTGDLEFIGRMDNQVKVRGYRIELGEIEFALRQVESVDEVVVTLKEVKGGGQQLVAYFVPSHGSSGGKSENSDVSLADVLREVAEKSLPSYMRPELYVVLDALPLTVNGKVDTKQLPDPEVVNSSYVAPVTNIEMTLANIWREVLGVERVGVHDKFFELGGHSLLAIKLITHIHRSTQLTVTFKDLLKYQTIADLINNTSPKSERDSTDLPELVMDSDNRHSPFPLTSIQQAYWVGRSDAYELGNVGTHGYAEIPIPEIDIDRLETVINQLIDRHEMLRMVVTENGEQKVLPRVPRYKIKYYDHRALSVEEQEKELEAIRNSLSHQVFSGLEWPLFDIRVRQTSERRVYLHISQDALIFDASSMQLVAREFERLYDNPDYPLPALKLSFRDYVLTLEKLNKTNAYEQSETYWQNRVSHFPLPIELPLAKSPAQIKHPRFERRSFNLDRDQWKLLQDWATQQNITPSVLIATCFSAVLNQWSSQPHFALNLTLFNRLPLHDQVNDILGDFTSLTLLEIDWRGPLNLVERMQAIQEQLWSDLEHRLYSGVEWQRYLTQAYGHTVQYPVVLTSVLGLPTSNEAQERKGIDLIKAAAGGYAITQTPQVWLDCQVSDYDGTLSVVWDSVAELFPQGMLDDMLVSMEHLLLNLLGVAEKTQLSLLAGKVPLPPAQQQLLATVNSTKAALPTTSLHAPLLTQIQVRPEKIAVITNDYQLSYGELGRRSRVLAKELVGSGLKRNELIAVMMPKGWEQVVAVLGVLRSGAAYLPVDSNLPVERIKQLLSLGKVRHVIATKAMLSDVELGNSYQCWTVTNEWVDNDQADDFFDMAKPGDLAYVIFTSGSTGVPKGVMIDHQSASNTMADINQRFFVRKEDVAFGLSNLNFDLSVFDIFGVLGAGGQLVLPAEGERREPDAWLNYIDQYSVTVWNTVPALMQMLIDTAELEQRRLPLNLILMSGDWIPTALPKRVMKACPNARIYSLGGATEASVWSIYHKIEKDYSAHNSVPYGKSLGNQNVYVLKSDMTTTPVWVTGDLYIGGQGLALGYWQDEEKTSASFIFHPETGQRLYKTGDRGRYLPDGNIEFQGRIDNQVKVRGYRIELGEIESAIKHYDSVKNAIVTHNRGQKDQLVAYITLNVPKRDAEKFTGKLTPREVAQFKLSLASVREEPGSIVHLSDSGLDQDLSFRVEASKNDAKASREIDLSSLSDLLRVAHRKCVSERPLPKAYYPSVGGLYPVQVYVSVPGRSVKISADDYVAEGYYYYHPINHCLVKLTDSGESQAETVEIILAADLDSINPVYGDLSTTFCWLEAGYLDYALRHEVSSAVIVGHPETANKAAEGEQLRHHLKLNKCHKILVKYPCWAASDKEAMSDYSVSYASRKSYREYLQEAPDLTHFTAFLATLKTSEILADSGLDIFVLIRRDISSGGNEILKKGSYQLSLSTNKLTKVGDQTIGTLYPENNVAFEKSAAFELFLVRDQDADITDSLLYAGQVGQLLSSIAPQFGIGLCAMGYVDESKVLVQFSQPNSSVVHSMLGGRVDSEKVNELRDSEAPALDISKELQSRLEKHLPSYMIPSAFVVVDEIPLTPNGKVDLKSLPAPESLNSTSPDYVAPQTEMEIELCNLWTSVLGVEKIGIYDNFFELGGNSLLVMKLISDIKAKHSVAISVSSVFEAKSLADLSRIVERQLVLEENKTTTVSEELEEIEW